MYDVPDQRGRRVVVTGANSGTGRETARRLAGAGAEVVLAVRDLDKGRRARRDIVHDYPDTHLDVRALDLADLSSVRAFADALVSEGRPVDVLVNNAGVMMPPRRMETVDGFELQMGTNFLGPFALSVRLVPLLLASTAPRVVTVSSLTAMVGRVRFDDLQWHRRYVAFAAYAQSKLADLLFARHLATLASERGWPLVSVAAHPGYTRTNLMTAGPNLGRRRPRRAALGAAALVASQSVERGVEPMLYAATSPDVGPGAYYGPNGLFGLVGATTLVRLPRAARSRDTAARLWRVAERLTGESLPDAMFGD